MTKTQMFFLAIMNFSMMIVGGIFVLTDAIANMSSFSPNALGSLTALGISGFAIISISGATLAFTIFCDFANSDKVVE